MKRALHLIALSILFACIPHVTTKAWGFWAHKKINRLAVFTLPGDLLCFYKRHIDLIEEQAVNPDKRRYAVDGEGPRHYIDIDHFGEYPFEGLPRKWDDAVAKYSEDTLQQYGIVPWHCNFMYYRLVNAFKEKNARKIINTSADLGHYLADAHVPLHTTENYNGQHTNQHGIHGLLESRIPELFADEYDFIVGKANYIKDPLQFVWEAVLSSHLATDSVFAMEIEATKAVGKDGKFGFDDRNTQTIQTYSEGFTKVYQDMLEGLVERRMRAAMIGIGSYWYSAWIDAGQPDVCGLSIQPLTEEEKKEMEALNRAYQSGQIKGRIEAK